MPRDAIRTSSIAGTSQVWGVGIGWLILIFVAAGHLGAKVWSFGAPIVMGAIIVAAAVRRRWAPLPKPDLLTLALAALAALTIVMALLGGNPTEHLNLMIVLLLFAAALLTCLELIRSLPHADTVRMGEGLWVGLLVGLSVMILDLLTHGHLRPSFVAKLMTVSKADLTRSVMPITLLLPPALLCLAVGVRSPTSQILSRILIGLAAVAVLLSPHETSKIALVAAALTFWLTRRNADFARQGLQVAWVGLCLLVVPFALLAHKTGLQNSPWLQNTAKQRIEIWHTYGQRAAERPLLGHGFNMSHRLRPEIPGIHLSPGRAAKQMTSKHPGQFRSLHPHNGFLQIWFEFGLAGALLLAAIGLGVMERLRTSPPACLPYAFATFAAGMTLFTSTYGIWQAWFTGVYGIAAIALAIALRLSASTGASAPAATTG